MEILSVLILIAFFVFICISSIFMLVAAYYFIDDIRWDRRRRNKEAIRKQKERDTYYRRLL